MRGKYISAQSMMEIASMTVPALLTKSHARVSMFCKTVLMLGIRYGGSSIMNGGGGAFSSVRFRMNATTSAATMPRVYIASISTAPRDTNPKTVCPVKKAPIISV